MLEDWNMNESANRGTGSFWDGFVRECGREVEVKNKILVVLPIIYQAKHHSGRNKWLKPLRPRELSQPTVQHFLSPAPSLNEANEIDVGCFSTFKCLILQPSH